MAPSDSEPAEAGAERIAALDRAVALVTLLGDGRSRNVSTISAELRVARQAVYRMLTSLSDAGWVRRDSEGLVTLGVGMLRLSAGVMPTVRRAASPIVQGLADQLGATSHLSIASDDTARALIVVEPSWTNWHVGYRVGTAHPLTVGAAGRAILTAREGDARVVRTEGELQPGAVGVAAGFVVHGLEASVGVIALDDLDVERASRAVVAAASRLARELASEHVSSANGSTR